MTIESDKRSTAVSISKEFDIVWLRWILLFIIAPAYIFMFSRKLNFYYFLFLILYIAFNILNHYILINKNYPLK
jgi:hypothetical protein